MTDLSKTVLITGASRGIGRALALQYAADGAHVIAVARRVGPAGPNITWIAADLSRAGDRRAVVAAVADSGRVLDVLVNNAGIQQEIDLTACAPEDFAALAQAEIAVNLTAPLVLTQALLPHIRCDGGTVVNVTSILSRHPKGSAPVYCASKAGLASFSRSLRHQLAPLGIRVAEAIPPLVATDMTAGRGKAKMTPEAMAGAIIRGVADGRSRIAPGFSRPFLAIDRVAPELAARAMIGG